jgi:succinate dehydrogenase/fumarate reductase flavoprotein subunit
MLVHGADAGRNAAAYARSVGAQPLDKQTVKEKLHTLMLPLTRQEGIGPAQVRRRVQEMAHKSLGPIRNREELLSFIRFLEELRENELVQLATSSKSRAYNKEWIDALELANMVHLLEAASRSALFRTESRGVHYREDHPYTDNDTWLHESIVKLTDKGLTVTKRPVSVTTITPPKGVTPYLDMMKSMMEAHSSVGGHH